MGLNETSQIMDPYYNFLYIHSTYAFVEKNYLNALSIPVMIDVGAKI